MRKYIIFLILLSIVKNRAGDCQDAIREGDWLTNPTDKCHDSHGAARERYQRICWNCVAAPRPDITWERSKGYLTGQTCPRLHEPGADDYEWFGPYPRKALYAIRDLHYPPAGGPPDGYGHPKIRLEYDQLAGGIIGDPCNQAGQAFPRQYTKCIYTLLCVATHEKLIRAAGPPPPLPPGRRVRGRVAGTPEEAGVHRVIPPPPLPPAKRVRGRVAGTPEEAGVHRVIIPPPPHHPPPASSVHVDFDDMLHYYIGGISDYLNNEYTDYDGYDYDGYDLDDQFEEMLTLMYMKGYKAGLNVERKWS